MTLPPCTCGHTAFEHFHAAPHDCAEGGCQCERFVPAGAAPDAAERRRLALLQAAAVMMSCGMAMVSALGPDAVLEASDHRFRLSAVNDAEALLDEIESREAERSKAGA